MSEKGVYLLGPSGAPPARCWTSQCKPMATAFLFFMGVLLPCWDAFPQVKKGLKKMNGARCSHHSQCFSDCCLLDLDHGGAFCAPKAKVTKVCLPKTKGATNLICPCQMGLSCISKDRACPRRCHLI